MATLTLVPFPRSTVRIPPLVLIIFLAIVSASASSSSSAKIPYAQHCNGDVQESTSNGHVLEPLDFLQLQVGYFNGGQKFLSTQTPDSPHGFRKTFSFHTNSLSKTETEGVLKLQATLSFYDDRAYVISTNSSSSRRRRQRSFYYGDGATVRFELQGFWSGSSGKLCMVGNGYGLSEEGDYVQLSAVTKLSYPTHSNIATSIVTGTVESVGSEDDSSYFKPISVLGFSQKEYDYTLVSEAEGNCGVGDPRGEKSLGLEPGTTVCSILDASSYGHRSFELKYKNDCSSRTCSPFDGFLPHFLMVGGIQCSTEGRNRMRMYLQLSNSSSYWYYTPLSPETGLVAEGVWDEKKNQLCLIGCRLKNFEGSLAETLVGDCSIGLSLTFSKVLSIKMRSPVVGSVWSLKKVNESGYFDQIGFQGFGNPIINGMKYDYSELGRLKKSCVLKDVKKNSGKRFPDGSSFEDMRFHMSANTVSEGTRRTAWVSVTPVSFGEDFYDPYAPVVLTEVGSDPEPELNFTGSLSNSKLHTPLNVSYSIDITFYDVSNTSRAMPASEIMRISAEGTYDAETGTLCMVGCRPLGTNGEISAKTNSSDCEILINIELAPFNSERHRLKGIIKSTREKKDEHYFEQLELTSSVFYGVEARETIWRMDLEITMVLVSLTLACVFMALQLFYVKKNTDVLPSISILMLVVLTFGHMIPLVLNFEALFFRDRNQQNVLRWSGGWLEVNEVLVRIFTMVAFLLQVRLLQLTFSARLAEGGKKGCWVAEKRAIRLCLLLYLVGGFVAWFVHSKKIEDPDSMIPVSNSQHSGWEDLKSYGGLVVDGFLLPQILLNAFADSKDKALAPPFYAGTTIVRLLPHAYDAYRAHRHLPHVNSSYFYADPGWDLYSAAWDAIIPCGGLMFAFLIFLQQRLGGAFFLPQRFRTCVEYEKVPVIGG